MTPIHIAHTLNGLSHEACYQLGYQDALEQVTGEEEGRAGYALSAAGRRLDALLDRVWEIAPYHLPDPVEAVSEAHSVYDRETT